MPATGGHQLTHSYNTVMPHLMRHLLFISEQTNFLYILKIRLYLKYEKCLNYF